MMGGLVILAAVSAGLMWALLSVSPRASQGALSAAQRQGVVSICWRIRPSCWRSASSWTRRNSVP
ncbi:hypothetical protein SGGMMB4_05796 (plasmid) [Sodalis glossinidius str. 'morsitans']|uniref:Uncharacterized protein n=1 Tax=Sodalis glossinidius (strain morsitans) TaxID=343509 RepID=A0A193QNV8_SODGM|nr:hypothetical protein SGGMMB4_05796 [Sodalis glossinidius str. 'morsitans']